MGRTLLANGSSISMKTLGKGETEFSVKYFSSSEQAVTLYKSVTQEGPLQAIAYKPLSSSSEGYFSVRFLEDSNGGAGDCQGLSKAPLSP